MATIIKRIPNVEQSSNYSEQVVRWCSEHLGKVIESLYFYDNTVGHRPLSPIEQEEYDKYVQSVVMFTSVTGVHPSGISDVQMYRGDGWWHFDCDINSVMVNVTILPDDTTAVYFKLTMP